MRTKIIRTIRSLLLLSLLTSTFLSGIAVQAQPTGTHPDPFQQIDSRLPTPNDTRLATGAPGPKYWQQKVDYQIEVALDESRKRIIGEEAIHYENRSPHTLTYLWLQLDANRFTPGSDARLAKTTELGNSLSVDEMRRILSATTFDGGVELSDLKDANGKALDHTIVKGMLRVNLPEALEPGEAFDFSLDWEFAINDSDLVPGRTGYEMFDDGNAIFCIAQWFPRLCAYTDYGGWRNKQFLGKGEFTLEFGDYDVRISAPADHVVMATGELVNDGEVLTESQQKRIEQALDSESPVFIVTPEEAKAAEKNEPAEEYKTWHFQAENVRDFAFASSRKFIWDACGQPVGDRTILCMSLYPKEGQPLWDQYATHAVAHTVEVYSEFTGIDYPWPHATAVMGVIGGGMEYPMICFNGPRPEKDGSYSESQKKRIIQLIIHEVGHNWFPMIINSDERHWMWLDEGFNTYVQCVAQYAWADFWGSSRADARDVAGSLDRNKQRPIMSQPDSAFDVYSTAYRKPAAGLSILRETILGRELFDFAFKEYCRRWAWKRPEPADFFRTMEDASGIDLDWFWNGWFYSTSHCDFEIVSIRRQTFHSGDPTRKEERHNRKEASKLPNLIQKRNEGQPRRVDRFKELDDFYTTFNPHEPTEAEKTTYQEFLDRLTDEEKKLIQFERPIYEIKVRNQGELVMPLILKLEFEDGSSEVKRYPAEIWRQATGDISRLLITEKPLSAVVVDPYHETGDTDTSNNRYPPQIETEDVKLTKPKEQISNPLHDQMKEATKEKTQE